MLHYEEDRWDQRIVWGIVEFCTVSTEKMRANVLPGSSTMLVDSHLYAPCLALAWLSLTLYHRASNSKIVARTLHYLSYFSLYAFSNVRVNHLTCSWLSLALAYLKGTREGMSLRRYLPNMQKVSISCTRCIGTNITNLVDIFLSKRDVSGEYAVRQSHRFSVTGMTVQRL